MAVCQGHHKRHSTHTHTHLWMDAHHHACPRRTGTKKTQETTHTNTPIGGGRRKSDNTQPCIPTPKGVLASLRRPPRRIHMYFMCFHPAHNCMHGPPSRGVHSSFMDASLFLCVCVRVCLYMCECVCVYACLYMCKNVCLSVCVCVCLCLRVCVTHECSVCVVCHPCLYCLCPSVLEAATVNVWPCVCRF